MKTDTLVCLEKDVGLPAWIFVELNSFMKKSLEGKTLKHPQDLLNLVYENLGQISKKMAYDKYGSKNRIDLEVCLSDTLFLFLKIIKAYNLNIQDVLRIGLVRYKERIWEIK